MHEKNVWWRHQVEFNTSCFLILHRPLPPQFFFFISSLLRAEKWGTGSKKRQLGENWVRGAGKGKTLGLIRRREIFAAALEFTFWYQYFIAGPFYPRWRQVWSARVRHLTVQRRSLCTKRTAKHAEKAQICQRNFGSYFLIGIWLFWSLYICVCMLMLVRCI